MHTRNRDNSVPLPTGVCFRDYCEQDEIYVQSLLDILFDPHVTLAETLDKHLGTVKSYLSGGRAFDEFCKQVRQYDNRVLCGLVWTTPTLSYRCRTCAINPCMSLCAECFHRGNHQGHDANMFRSVGGGLCDCGDQTVMRPSGFCKHHGQSRIPNESIPSHLIQGAQMIIPRLLVIQSERVRSPLATSHDGESQNRVECCICQSQDDQSVLGLAIRLFVTGVLGTREIDTDAHSEPAASVVFGTNEPPSIEDLLTCVAMGAATNETKSDGSTAEVESTDGSATTCAQFYESKQRTMLRMFSKESVSQSLSICWRSGLVVDTCGHSIHLSCYEQYLKTHQKASKIPFMDFKCPMCRQTSNALLCSPKISEQAEPDGSVIDAITHLLEQNVKPCIPAGVSQWLVSLVEKMYSMVPPCSRTMDESDREPDDDKIALFLVSILRFNLENELLVRQALDVDRNVIQRKSCFRELFYLCSLKYPYLMKGSHLTTWQKITSLISQTPLAQNRTVPLLFSDSISLLLRIILALPYPIPSGSFRVIVQAVFNLTYIQALFTTIVEMNRSEQEAWCQEQHDSTGNITAKYIRIVASRLVQSPFHSEQDNGKIWSIKSIEASIREQGSHFLQIAGLLQHHLYQPMTWWFSGPPLPSDRLWNNLMRELQLQGNGEPFWFIGDVESVINRWLDELITVDPQQWKKLQPLARMVPRFHPAHFIQLHSSYSELLRSYDPPRCSQCRQHLADPILCLVCGKLFSRERSDQKGCHHRALSKKEHTMACGGGLNIFLHLGSSKILIEQEQKYAFWTSLYLDEHGEEDPYFKRGRLLYLDANRLKLLQSAWISSSLDRLVHRWSSDPFDF